MRIQQLSQLKLNAARHAHWKHFTWSASGNFWDSPFGKVLRHSVHAVLLIAIALVLASMWPRGRLERVASNAPTARAVAPADWGSTLVAAHLFGQAPNLATVTPPALASRAIRVDGIVYGLQPTGSQAILTIKGKTDVY